MNKLNTGNRNPIAWVPTVYFAMGIPYIAISLVSSLMFKDMGISDTEIAFWTSLLVLPWSLKPFFSLIMELVGTKKQYLVFAEFIISLMFGLIAFSLHLPSFFTISIMLMGALAICGSTQDIAGDGLYLTELSKKQQGQYAGWQGAFYNLAKILTNGGLVYLAGVLGDHYGVAKGWAFIMFICGVLILLLAIYHSWVLPSGRRAVTDYEATHSKLTFKEAMKEFGEVFRTFFVKKHIFYYIFFIIMYRFAEGLALKIAPLFLKADIAMGGLGLSNRQYGLIYGTFGSLAFIIGSILSGYYISYFGLKKTLFSLALIFNVQFVVYMLFAIYQPSSMVWISVGIILEYFAFGSGFVGLMLFMMQQIAPGKYQMAHYAFATSIMNLGYMIPGMISGKLSTMLGYKNFFIIVVCLTILPLITTYFVPFTHADKAEE